MKAIFGDISGAETDCITVWHARKIMEVESVEQAVKIMLKERFNGCVIPSLLAPGVKLRIPGVNLTIDENPVPKAPLRKEQQHGKA